MCFPLPLACRCRCFDISSWLATKPSAGIDRRSTNPTQRKKGEARVKDRPGRPVSNDPLLRVKKVSVQLWRHKAHAF